MTFVYAFLCCGTFCLLGQIIYDNSKLTPGVYLLYLVFY